MDHIELTATPLELQTQGSPFQVHHLGNFNGIPGTSFPVWHSKKAIANTLVIHKVAKHCQITMDTSINPTISVRSPSGIILPFRQTDMGLFTYHSDSHPNPLDPIGSSYLCQQTIANQWKLYTPQQLEQVTKPAHYINCLDGPLIVPWSIVCPMDISSTPTPPQRMYTMPTPFTVPTLPISRVTHLTST